MTLPTAAPDTKTWDYASTNRSAYLRASPHTQSDEDYVQPSKQCERHLRVEKGPYGIGDGRPPFILDDDMDDKGPPQTDPTAVIDLAKME